MKLVDVVVEMLDARIPRSSTNPMLKEVLGTKPRVIALNKIDMADSEQTEKWQQFFKNAGLQVVKVDCAKGRGVKELLALVQQAAQPIQEKWLKKGVRGRSTRVMIVGIPNVGKSTLINRLVGKNKVNVENRPGVTRGQQWVTIGKGLELLDTPGVLWPKFEDPEVGFALAATGAIKEDVFDRTQAAELLIEWLCEYYPGALGAFYKVEIALDDAPHLVKEKIAKARGCIKSGGAADLDKAEQMLLRDFRFGKIGRFTLDRK